MNVSRSSKSEPVLNAPARGNHAVVFFTKSKTADVVKISAISGECVVNELVKVHWNKKLYKAKVLFVGKKSQCEQMVKDVTEEGSLNSFFTVAESTVAIEGSHRAETLDNGPVVEAVKKLEAGMSEVVEQVMATRRSVAGILHGFENKVQSSFSHVERRLSDLEASVEEMKIRQRREDAETGLDFSLLPRERVESLLALKCGKLTKFALALEQELYEHDSTELELNVEERKITARRVVFIREVVFKYFNVSYGSRKGVWQTVKNALNSRARSWRNRARNNTLLRSRSLSISPRSAMDTTQYSSTSDGNENIPNAHDSNEFEYYFSDL